jgi:YD repeat-containing protein
MATGRSNRSRGDRGTGGLFSIQQTGLLSSAIEHSSSEKGTFQHWQETTYDRQGRPIARTNYEGLKVAMAYDTHGGLASMVQKTPKGDISFQFRHDDRGRLQTVKSPWGDTACTYDPEGELRQVTRTRDGRKARVELEGGAVQRRFDFDGGETIFNYRREGPHAGLPREVISPDGLRLTYSYDDRARLTRVRVGQVRGVEVTYDDLGRLVAYSWIPD